MFADGMEAESAFVLQSQDLFFYLICVKDDAAPEAAQG